MLPKDFWDLPKEEQAMMIAWAEAKNEMIGYSEQQAAEKPAKG